MSLLKRPFLVVGEGMVAPFMAACLRTAGLNVHLSHQPNGAPANAPQTIVLVPDVTHYLTGDLGLAGMRPRGNHILHFHSYDQKANVLMNLNVETLKPDEGGTFFCTTRAVIEDILMRECRRGARHLEHGNPVRILNQGQKLVKLTPGVSGGVVGTFSNGMSHEYQAVVNVSSDVNAVPLLDGGTTTEKDRAALLKTQQLALKRAPKYLEWTIDFPGMEWQLGADELGEIVDSSPRRGWFRPVGADKITACLRIPDSSVGTAPNLSAKSALLWWERGKLSHPLWTHAMAPALEQALFSQKNLDAHVSALPKYIYNDWAEEGGRHIRLGPAAHSVTHQPVGLKDAMDFEDCMLLAEHLAEHGMSDVTSFLQSRREDVVDEMNSAQLLDDMFTADTSRLVSIARRIAWGFTKTPSRTWKRALRPFCTKG